LYYKSHHIYLPSFIAQRLQLKAQHSFAYMIVNISIAALALGIAVMIIANSMVNGFQYEVKRKLFDFWGHAHVLYNDNNISFQEQPIPSTGNYLDSILSLSGITNIEPYIKKAGILKTPNDIEGIVLKGISKEHSKSLIGYINKGRAIHYTDTASQDILISEKTANRLKLKIHDKVLIYFIENNAPPKIRKFYVSGIYSTGLMEYDQVYALVDIAQLQAINNWGDSLVSGYQLNFENINDMEKLSKKIELNYLDYDMSCKSLRDINPNIFDWLSLQKINEYIILGLMFIVAIVNMVNMLLILILERTQMIGVLKSLGAKDTLLQGLFLWVAARVIGWGLILGNIVGISICLIQKYGNIIRLPEESYYMKVAPVLIDWQIILLINIVVILLTLSALLLPTFLVKNIAPVKVLRFE